MDSPSNGDAHMRTQPVALQGQGFLPKVRMQYPNSWSWDSQHLGEWGYVYQIYFDLEKSTQHFLFFE